MCSRDHEVVEGVGGPGGPSHPAGVRVVGCLLRMGRVVRFLAVFEVCRLLPVGVFLGRVVVWGRDVQLGRGAAVLWQG